MKAPFILLLFVFSFGPIGAVSADYSDGWDAYKKENGLWTAVEQEPDNYEALVETEWD